METVYLDTQAILYFHDGKVDSVGKKALELLNRASMIKCSPFVRLELQYLYEVNKQKIKGNQILHELEKDIGLQECQIPLQKIIQQAEKVNGICEPFDRLICAHALAGQGFLITGDYTILEHFKHAVWS